MQNFDPAYYGEFKFDDSVRRALKHESPSPGGCANKKPLKAYADDGQRRSGVMVVPLAANLGTGKLEALPAETSVVDALMCACAVVPFFRAQSISKDGAHRPRSSTESACRMIRSCRCSRRPAGSSREQSGTALGLSAHHLGAAAAVGAGEAARTERALHRPGGRGLARAPAPALSGHAPRQEPDRPRQPGARRQARDRPRRHGQNGDLSSRPRSASWRRTGLIISVCA